MRGTMLFLVLLGLIGFLMFAESISSHDSYAVSAVPDDGHPMSMVEKITGERQPRKPPTQKDINIDRAVRGALSLKSAMRNPDSFTVESALVMDSGAVCYEYRSQNGFGGLNQEQAVLTPKDNILLTTHRGFAAAWEKFCHGKRGDDAEALINLGSF